MRKHRPTLLALTLLLVLVVGCNWPLSHPDTEPPAATRSSSPEVESPGEQDGGRREVAVSTATGPATAFVSPLVTPTADSAGPTPVAVLGRGGLFSGRTIRFDLPEGYHVLEGVDGGCFVYHETLPGFLVLYPTAGGASKTLTDLLNATTNTQRTESPLEVDIGGLTFVGLFVETDTDDRIFLAAAEGWALVAQGPVDGWPTLAAGLNQVLVSLTFEEGTR